MLVQSIKGHYGSNTFVVGDGGEVIVIDAGAPLDKVLKVLGGKKPAAVLLTHEHFDHVYYSDGYKKEFNCPVYAPDSEDEIKLNKLVIKPILCPGHSPKSVVYLICDILFTGDVLFKGTIGRTDLMDNGEELMQKTLRRLLNVKFKTAYHSHGEPSDYEHQQQNIRSFIV